MEGGGTAGGGGKQEGDTYETQGRTTQALESPKSRKDHWTEERKRKHEASKGKGQVRIGVYE